MNKILVLGCNYDQIPYLVELKKHFFIVGADMNINAPGKEYCDKFYVVGYDEYDKLLDIGIKERFITTDKVFTAAAQFALIGASIFAKKFNIPFIDENAISIVLDKSKFYSLFQRLQIPIPDTFYIKNRSELDSKILELGSEKSFYLKSDFSKNPKHVYKIKQKTIESTNIFWGKDRFLRNHYILQEEFFGEHLRINVIKENFILFPMNYGDEVITTKDQIIELNVLKSLKLIISKLGLDNWIVKFDVILNKDSFVVLDIGLDPPFRLNKLYTEKSLNFPKHYINLLLNGEVSFKLLEYDI